MELYPGNLGIMLRTMAWASGWKEGLEAAPQGHPSSEGPGLKSTPPAPLAQGPAWLHHCCPRRGCSSEMGQLTSLSALCWEESVSVGGRRG